MLKTQGMGIEQVCQDTGLDATDVHHWLAQFDAEQLAQGSTEQAVTAQHLHATPLPITRLHFLVRAEASLQLPQYAGSMLRGAFGHALLALAPMPHTGGQPCAQHQTCPYCQIFATPALPAYSLQKFNQMPHPYVIEPPALGVQQLPSGQVFGFSMVLMGHALAYLPTIVLAWERALHTGLGLGVQQVRCNLLSVQQEGANAPLWQTGQTLPPALVHIPLPPAPLLGQQATLNLLTPLRLQHQGKPARANDLNARSLLVTLARRYQLLLDINLGSQAPQQDFAVLSDQAQSVDLTSQDMHWLDWGRYSQRQQQEMKLGGLLGRLHLHGDLAPFSALLHLGQWLHLGKNTSFGLGGYQLTHA